MSVFRSNLKPIVAAIAATVGFSLPLAAGPVTLDELLQRLQTADAVDAARIEREIELEWAKSGSPAMDLLFKRGVEALEAEDYAVAIEHLTALTDHAPDFASGWYNRGQAFALAGMIGPALHDLERALVLDPRHYDAIFGLGTILEQIGRPERAYDAYRLVLDLHPHHEEAQQLLKRLEGDVNGVEL
ncbi:tetratricopeptide repeat protein [Marimonas arenosa]|uniref:Tetratricopeptide repeat protein n=1 Tax=Marimonas arenosa TaxID=1795305 RepID=A0AAE3WE76_9RHOB|nr:tetratricopeptide repeat protein [Marimonas arenosa]MDQ2091092.1 tetratricopeptide repeat protein [Marimonas arenosa]